ncbi:DUF3349 domain-containing protein [Nakamurella endophytica]|uniref:DUF3349 domain-containing protein n=1 Tax=Nakamurella endophytica TaxID=1748367 RepID=A0A917T3X4_9ACTN|nr:DUF3349 domain-containing protein [Nakamurella endophytica]GGM07443.1 hypothetical protein GCM10011594_29260 [Nakamurella endophytica]
MTERTGFFSSVVSWLRAGYPDGVPPKDCLPLIAVLRHRLTDVELDEIVATLVESGELEIDRSRIGEVVGEVSRQPPSDEDVARVSARLAAGGWPLAPDADVPAAAGPS